MTRRYLFGMLPLPDVDAPLVEFDSVLDPVPGAARGALYEFGWPVASEVPLRVEPLCRASQRAMHPSRSLATTLAQASVAVVARSEGARFMSDDDPVAFTDELSAGVLADVPGEVLWVSVPFDGDPAQARLAVPMATTSAASRSMFRFMSVSCVYVREGPAGTLSARPALAVIGATPVGR